MNRRGFLKLLGVGSVAAGTGAIALLDQEVWTPARTFFLPPVGGWVGGNRLLTLEMITKEALVILESELVLAKRYEGIQWRTANTIIGSMRRPAMLELNRIIERWAV